MRKGPKPTWIYLVAAARKIWRWSNERKEVKKEATNCKACGTKFTPDTEPEIDHTLPIGRAPRSVCGDAASFKGWDKYYAKLFINKEGLQPLCRKCHLEKTKKERKK